MEDSTRIIDMTIADLNRLLDERERLLVERIRAEVETGIPSHVEGIKGIARIYGCSMATAQRIKNSGRIDAAITQVGRKIVTDTRLALALLQKGGRA